MAIFALVDCNSFYCSCEQLFRPDLLNRPVGVLSNNDGCFVSRTNELKALGVQMGAPYFKVRDICEKNNVAVFSANFSLYTNLSDRVMITLSSFTPELEIYSVDEAFLNLTGFENWNLEEYGREIKKTVERNTGIPVSIGIGPTKTLAKAANLVAKKDKSYGGVLSILNQTNQDKILSQLSIDDVWGIGRKNSPKFKFLNIKTAKELRDYQNDKLIQKIFTKTGRIIQDELRGIPCHELNIEVKKKKEIISSRTFGAPVFDLNYLRESVANYASLACEKLRSQNSVCSVIEIWIRTNLFKETPQYYALDTHKLLAYTSDTRKIIRYAWQVLDKLYRHGYEYKKAFVKLSGIRDSEEHQLSFFEEEDTQKSQELMKVMDKINRKEGPHTLRSAACGINNQAWYMKQTLRSPRYLTSWNELPKVK